MAVCTIREPTAEDIDEVLANLSEDELAEIWASRRLTPKDVKRELPLSETYVAEVAGDLICMFGVQRPTLLDNEAACWMLTTDKLRHHGRAFLRASRKVVEDFKARYPRMVNYIDARSVETIAWLRWCGFTVYDAEPFGPDQIPFHRYEVVAVKGKVHEKKGSK